MEFYNELKKKFKYIMSKENFTDENIIIRTKSLTPDEAIGKTKRKDYPILSGKEIMVEADFRGSKGQAFTSSPCTYSGTIKDILELDLRDNYNKSIFISSMNAILSYLGLINGTIHCRDEEPELCGKSFRAHFMENDYIGKNIALIGFQPSIMDNLREVANLRVLDLNEDNIGKVKYEILIEDGIKDFDDVMDWADLILCTGSTILNGSIINFINREEPVIFYGTSIAGAAFLMDLDRLCFYT
ncbi:MAG: DUF364 domain-containing protein [Andreesenia angusta]|nr:DUF364 domain-containing protein [Andreesenia angusta]